MFRTAAIAIILSLFVTIVLSCLATQNPQVPETTVMPCTCQFPRNTAAPECGAGPMSLPTFSISTDTPCVVTWTGCVNYRYVVDGACVTGPQNADPTTVQGGFQCTTSSFPQSNGQTYMGVDCG